MMFKRRILPLPRISVKILEFFIRHPYFRETFELLLEWLNTVWNFKLIIFQPQQVIIFMDGSCNFIF